MDGFDSTVAAQGDWLALGRPHPSSLNKLDLIEGGRTFSQNLLDKCVHTGPQRSAKQRTKKLFNYALH